ncbi:HU family DNA-binding protein [Porphyromonas pogonae]|uniref:HU family DNA-binding protein n=1 Tax=Porphyromonas pogonae TaxID=867595 RepID=UPI002E766062|nr:HU family DNA-binding protein [Porphyromonas pogonae]
MIQFKPRQSKIATKDGKRLWYPNAISSGEIITTKRIANDIAARSGASVGDVIGILMDLGPIMRNHLSDGRRVILNGVGSFRISANARGKGVESKEKVTANQFSSVKVIFFPEKSINRHLGVEENSLISSELRFTPAVEKLKKDKPGGGGSVPGNGGSGL